MISYTNNMNKAISGYIKVKNYKQIIILTDTNTNKYCLNLLDLDFSNQLVITISEGESNKNIQSITYIWQELLKNNINRHALFINLGGGVISDMGGFCASTYKRGIDFINIPTTVLAMVDATVGGKLGFNFENQKNMIGLFNTPKNIFIDFSFLQTLSYQEVLNGLAEAFKHGILFDIDYFFNISRTLDQFWI